MMQLTLDALNKNMSGMIKQQTSMIGDDDNSSSTLDKGTVGHFDIKKRVGV
jgi:hypothetical protein